MNDRRQRLVLQVEPIDDGVLGSGDGRFELPRGIVGIDAGHEAKSDARAEPCQAEQKNAEDRDANGRRRERVAAAEGEIEESRGQHVPEDQARQRNDAATQIAETDLSAYMGDVVIDDGFVAGRLRLRGHVRVSWRTTAIISERSTIPRGETSGRFQPGKRATFASMNSRSISQDGERLQRFPRPCRECPLLRPPTPAIMRTYLLPRHSPLPRGVSILTVPMSRTLLSALIWAVAMSSVRADGPTGAIDFNRQIRPILSDNCFACHGPDEQQRKAKLRLDSFASATAKLRHGGFAIVPGRPDDSELVRRIVSDDPGEKMPPAKTQKHITPAAGGIAEAMDREGAKYAEHWAFVAPHRPTLPAVKNDNGRETRSTGSFSRGSRKRG